MSDLLQCSIIVDDQILIWEDNLQKNVIGSKKFVPFITEQQIKEKYYHEIMVEKNDQVDIRNIIKKERNLILHKKKIIMIEFYTDNIPIQQTLIQLIQLMGGKIMVTKVGEYILEKNLLKADFVIAEQNLFSVRESYFKKIMKNKQKNQIPLDLALQKFIDY
ncbi:hypothetical protein PPERSA_06660 [Pseudocohnilembus persalinus]|uniref:Uncharacterized protein n=1 Tax=Pseudocohnilembus persalinus TaxID=266149 RepID=A0A0V0QRS9_PSEPJ|nr:hypothetical protein PPERSA_06660 [Pseudocohnilembus persalinus]|eukprot:KRX05026.1 hypothetical protein PPERSA_06660 [Pseudocohnilembus persalinus]